MDASVYVILCCLVLGGDASGSCGALTVKKPTFLNRNVTLKFIPHNQWITNIVWKFSPWWDKTSEFAVEMLKGRSQQTVQDGSHYHSFLFYADKYFNNSKFHVQCSNTMEVTRSNTVKIHLHEIKNECGNLMLLSPEIKYGTDVEIAYYPSYDTLNPGNIWFHERTLLKGVAQPVHLRNNTFEERKMSVYLYIFTIHNYTESKAGRYALRCGKYRVFTTNWLNIHVTDKQLIGPVRNDCIYGNADTTIYCNTSRTTEGTRVTLSIGNKGVVILANETERGVYTVVLDSNTWRDHDGDVVTCNVSNENYEHDLKSSAKLCYMEKGSNHILNMAENIHNENTTISCQVSNVRPPALLEILVDNIAIIGVVKEDLLNKTSKTYTSKASISKIDKHWNGKEICCRRIFTIHGYKEASCKTLEINCSLGNDTRVNGLCNETKLKSNITEVDEDRTIKQKPHPPKNEITFRHDPTSVPGGNSRRSFKVTLEAILIGTGAFVALCVFVASARSLVRWHKGRNKTRDPDNTEAVTIPATEVSLSLDTNEYGEMPETSMHMNASHDLEDDFVELKIPENSIMARKPITAVKSKHAEKSLIYVNLDIGHLQQARVCPIPGPRPAKGKEAKVYEEIDFSSTKHAGPHLVL
ncbi:uncharacterized protein LOC128242231 [Mya arenaria]|uniref:uncharacterized protein LOC128242231 n=1 Tax=Mya arenaria TaxID=6604 RepID=UPI0022E61866|nr:uncharacterized protein LOC128242231 [Mya arenaria]